MICSGLRGSVYNCNIYLFTYNGMSKVYRIWIKLRLLNGCHKSIEPNVPNIPGWACVWGPFWNIPHILALKVLPKYLCCFSCFRISSLIRLLFSLCYNFSIIKKIYKNHLENLSSIPFWNRNNISYLLEAL